MVALLSRLLVEMMNIRKIKRKAMVFLPILALDFTKMKDNDDEVLLPSYTSQKVR